MNNGISIEFFTPDLPEKVKKGTLFINNNGSHILEIDEVLIENTEVPIKIGYATSRFNEQFSLINCVFQSTDFAISWFRICELYKGFFLEKVTEKKYSEAKATITSLTNWLNHFINEFSFSGDECNVSIKKPFEKRFSINSICTLELTKFSHVTRENDEINLKSKSEVSFKFHSPTTRKVLHEYVQAFSKFLFLFIDGVPKISSINYTNTDKEVIAQILSENNLDNNRRDSFCSFTDIENYFEFAINKFYSRRNEFIKIINLIISSYSNKTPEIAFLNITTAFEFFHENFRPKVQNVQSQLYFELFGKLPIQTNEKNWSQVVRTYDLLNCVIHLKYFKDNIPDLKRTAHLIKESRNHYTHYNETNKQIWTPNELLKNSKLLRELLKALIFIELQFPDFLIEKILRSRPATFYQNFDENEYSVFFKE